MHYWMKDQVCSFPSMLIFRGQSAIYKAGMFPGKMQHPSATSYPIMHLSYTMTHAGWCAQRFASQKNATRKTSLVHHNGQAQQASQFVCARASLLFL